LAADTSAANLLRAGTAGHGKAIAATPAAYASLPPHGGGPVGTHTVRVIATGGMPGWQITLIAAAAAAAAAVMAVLADRAWGAREAHATTA
jgi:hypothetical protein